MAPRKSRRISVPKDVQKSWKQLNRFKLALIKRVVEESIREVADLEPESTSLLKSLCKLINVECNSFLITPTSDIAEYNENAETQSFEDPKTISEAMSHSRSQLTQLEKNNEKLRMDLATAKEKLDDIHYGKTHPLLSPQMNYLNLPKLSKI